MATKKTADVPATVPAPERVGEIAPMDALDEDRRVRVLAFRTKWLETLAERSRMDLEALKKVEKKDQSK